MSKNDYDRSYSKNSSVIWWVRLCRWLWKMAVILGSLLFFPLVLNLLSTSLTNSKGLFSYDSPIGWLLTQWPVILPIIVCLFLLAILARMASRWPSSPLDKALPTSEILSLQQNRTRTLEQLHRTYEEWLAHSLQGVSPIDLGLAEKPDALHNARSLLFRSQDHPERLLPAGTSILDAYDLAEHELLILGEPGAGKSTLLQRLAMQLTTRALSDAAHPLPVLLPLESWADKRLPLQEWIVEQLTHFYNVPPQLSRQWIESDLLLPLLDGIDEVDPDARLACIVAMNAFHLERFAVPFVVCSRKMDYERATVKRRLILQRAIVVQPLTSEQIDTALTAGGKPLAALRSAFKKNRTLQELATTPLMLSVLMMTYQGVTIRSLSTQGNQLQQQIWEDYVQRMISSRGDATSYPRDVTKKWLGWLAREMRKHNQTIFSMEQLQPDWLSGKRPSVYWWSYRLGGGFLIGFLCWQFFKVTSNPDIGLLSGGSAWLLFGMLSGQSTQRKPAVVTSKPLQQFTQSMLIGLALGTFPAFFLALSSGHFLDILPLLITIGFCFGVFIGLLFWFVNRFLSKQVNKKHSGLFLWLGRGLHTTAQYYLLRLWLWRLHIFPWKAGRFLDSCTTRILLRRVEGGYSFTHRLLLDYFADLDASVPPS